MTTPTRPTLVELQVQALGIIDELTVVLSDGLTTITGETGAGKTLLVDAVELLLGGRADASTVRRGEPEARVGGRFVDAGGEELVLERVVPAAGAGRGRSRAYVNGRLATAGELAQAAAGVVDLHGQHAHHSLVTPVEQRRALDRFAGNADALAGYREARAEGRRIGGALEALGGDERGRAREIDLLRFQLDEIEGAQLTDVDEDDDLAREEARLGDAAAHRDALARARGHVDGPAVDAVGEAAAALDGRAPFDDLASRLAAAQAELADLADELRVAGEAVDEDPTRLEVVRARRRRLHELRRKYGSSLGEVLSFGAEVRARLEELDGYEARAAELERARDAAEARIAATAAELGRRRLAAAGTLGEAVTARLGRLGMPSARCRVGVRAGPPGDDGADEVTFLLAANPGEPALPLAKVASGGELARTMLGLRVVLAAVEPAPVATVLVFDEVDAGLGGEAGRAVGRALAELARTRQVLCVTHLAQVAAFADAQVVVEKSTRDGRTTAGASVVSGDARVHELSRMLAGVGESRHARRHAEELLADARDTRGERRVEAEVG